MLLDSVVELKGRRRGEANSCQVGPPPPRARRGRLEREDLAQVPGTDRVGSPRVSLALLPDDRVDRIHSSSSAQLLWSLRLRRRVAADGCKIATVFLSALPFAGASIAGAGM